jgi:hypothetical protein
MSVDNGQPQHPPARRASLVELAPQWIIAIATLIAAVAGAGFFAGQQLAPQSSNVPQPPATTQPQTTTATVPSTAPVASQTPVGAAMAGGTQLGSYTFQIVRGYSVPLHDTEPPKQAEYVNSNSGQDLSFSAMSGTINPGNASIKMISLGTTPPSYSACTTGTVFITGMRNAVGSTFCFVMPGRVIGGKIVSNGQIVTDPVGISITVWSGPA